MNKHIFFLIVLLLSWSITTTGQQNAPEPDKFGQLVLNQTSPDEAIQYLGKVESDKIDSLNASQLSKWLDQKHKDRLFRKLRFKNIGVMSSVELSFLENKLIMIELEFRKNVKPENLKALFGVDFAHIGGPSPLPDKPGEYPRASVTLRTSNQIARYRRQGYSGR